MAKLLLVLFLASCILNISYSRLIPQSSDSGYPAISEDDKVPQLNPKDDSDSPTEVFNEPKKVVKRESPAGSAGSGVSTGSGGAAEPAGPAGSGGLAKPAGSAGSEGLAEPAGTDAGTGGAAGPAGSGGSRGSAEPAESAGSGGSAEPVGTDAGSGGAAEPAGSAGPSAPKGPLPSDNTIAPGAAAGSDFQNSVNTIVNITDTVSQVVKQLGEFNKLVLARFGRAALDVEEDPSDDDTGRTLSLIDVLSEPELRLNVRRPKKDV